MGVKFLRHTLAASMKRWKTKNSILNIERDYQKFWRFAKQLNGEDNQRVATVLKENGDIVTCKQAAHSSDNYEDVSNIPVNMNHQKESRQN